MKGAHDNLNHGGGVGRETTSSRDPVCEEGRGGLRLKRPIFRLTHETGPAAQVVELGDPHLCAGNHHFCAQNGLAPPEFACRSPRVAPPKYNVFSAGVHSPGGGSLQCSGTDDVGEGSLPSTAPHSSQDDSGSSPSWSSFRWSFMRDRDKAKQPSRGIARYAGVTLFIVNDVVHGTWVLIPFLMGFNGWTGGLLLMLLVGFVNYYCCDLLFRMSRVFRGAVTFGDLAFYITRSPALMFLTFVLSYGLVFTTLSQQLSMGANIFNYVMGRGALVDVHKVIWLAIMACVLIPMSQLRALKSLFWINLVNVISLLIFWAIGLGGTIAFMAHTHPDVPAAQLPRADNLALFPTTLDADQISFPLAGVTVAMQCCYYQMVILEVIAEMEKPADFPKAHKIAAAAVGFLYFTVAVVMYCNYAEIYEYSYSFRDAVVAFVAPLNERWLGRLAGFFFALDLTGSTLIRVVILGRALHLLMWPKCANKSTWRARGQFGAITTAVVVLSAVVAAVIPDMYFLSSINGLYAIVVCAMMPCLYMLYASIKLKTKRLRTRLLEKGWLVVIVAAGAATIVLFVIRTAAAADTMACVLRTEFEHTIKDLMEFCDHCSHGDNQPHAPKIYRLHQACNITLHSAQ